jgi:cysteine-rich repeat protein
MSQSAATAVVTKCIRPGDIEGMCRRAVLSVAAVVLLAFGCGDDVPTSPLIVNPRDTLDASQAQPEPTCGDEKREGYEECDDGNMDPGDGCDSDCLVELPLCGDGALDAGEECDDGDVRQGDGCDHRCRVEVCGNGRRDSGEQCDDGNDGAGDGCGTTCRLEATPAACGDERLDPGEACDDGNIRPGDGCNAECQIETCGNRVVDEGEQCEPPSTGACAANCQLVSTNCGDGAVQADEGEECDDHNDVRGDGCARCRFECGNRMLERDIGEECEPIWSAEGTCGDDCKRPPLCGDGVLEGDEQCDPSNGVTCVNCRSVVIPTAVCGNGEVEFPEQCDSSDGETCVNCRFTQPMCLPQNETIVLVTNGTFDANVTGWAIRTPVVATLAASAGVGATGAMRLHFAAEDRAGRHVSGAVQCINVAPATAYTFDSAVLVPSSTSELVALGVELRTYASDDCAGDFTRPTTDTSLMYEPGVWSAQTRTFETRTSTESLSVYLFINKPRDAVATIYWDDIALTTDVASRCGDCVLDPDEECDDGNRRAGDGCGAFCSREICGNNAIEGAEECDDGALLFGGADDLCTPSCRIKTGCDTCAFSSCAPRIAGCLDLLGRAGAGVGEGKALSTLCDELRACAHRTGCDNGGTTLENCYCGPTDSATCFGGGALGICRAEIEAALETTEPQAIMARMATAGGSVEPADPDYPIFARLRALMLCESTAGCDNEEATRCSVPLACGDGLRQERAAEVAEQVTLRFGPPNPAEIECENGLTATGAGCSIEECDDGNLTNGDGCDAECFVEVCGNAHRQAQEQCDDGNRMDGDGCDASCQLEYECEECDASVPL